MIILMKLELQHATIWRKWIMEKAFWIQFKSESICMCWKHKTKTGQCHCLIIFVNIGWKCAALSWASIVANLFSLCNRILLMSPFHDLVLIVTRHLIRNNSALFSIFSQHVCTLSVSPLPLSLPIGFVVSIFAPERPPLPGGITVFGPIPAPCGGFLTS